MTIILDSIKPWFYAQQLTQTIKVINNFIKALSPAPHSNNDFEVSIDIFTISEFSLDILHNNDNLRDMIIKFIETENSLLESEIVKMNIEIQIVFFSFRERV